MPAPRKDLPPPTSFTSLDAREVIEVKIGVFKDTCLQLLDQVYEQGMEVVITKRGIVIARVVPPDERLPSAFAFMHGTVLAHEDLIAPDVGAWGELG